MTPERERIEQQTQATMSEGARVRERALRELTELDRVLRHEAAPPGDESRERDERGEEKPWWRLWS